MQLLGTVIDELELRFTPEGKALCSFNVRYEEEEVVFLIYVIAWEELAEKLNEHLTKYSEVRLFGSKKQREWITSQGEKKSRAEFTANRVQILKLGEEKL